MVSLGHMSKIMPNNEVEERYRWIGPINDKVLTIKQMVLISPFSERTLKYWLAGYREQGLEGLKSKSRKPHYSPRATSKQIKDEIIEMRKDTRLCARKISWKLEKQGVCIHERTIGKILKKKGLVRKYRREQATKWKPKPVTRPGQLMEIDVKYGIRLAKYRWWYQFTAIDCASRWRHLYAYDSPNNFTSVCFLRKLIQRTPFKINAVKTDNAEIFTNKYSGYQLSKDPFNPKLHIFDVVCNELNIDHYLIDRGKPAQNGKVERSHRSDKESFYYFHKEPRPKSLEEYRYYLNLWNLWYNNLEHCSLNGLSPNEYLKKVQNVWF